MSSLLRLEIDFIVKAPDRGRLSSMDYWIILFSLHNGKKIVERVHKFSIFAVSRDVHEKFKNGCFISANWFFRRRHNDPGRKPQISFQISRF